jgi:hypothetical protein
MGKLTLSLLGVCVLIFGLVVIQVVDPRGTLVGLLFGGCAGIALFITGPIWLVKKVMSGHMDSSKEPNLQRAQVLASKSDAEIVELLDETFNRVALIANHPWLAQHWHKLGSDEKVSWVSGRRAALNLSLSQATMPMHFVTALQKVESAYNTKVS